MKMGTEALRLEDLGYDEFFSRSRASMGLDDFAVARVIAEHRGAYKVKNENSEYFAKITGKRMFEATSREDYPAVGDWVAIDKADAGQAVIRSVLARKTLIKRKSGDKNKTGEKNEIQVIAANIDVAFVVESVDRDFNLNRFERYFALLGGGSVRPVIVLNKTDLVSREDLELKVARIKDRFNGVDLILASTKINSGLDQLKKYITKGMTYCFLGSSGVGKSSLINRLLGEEIIKTEKISSHAGRGKHVTTGREMYFLSSGGIVIDNPGMREVGVADAGESLDTAFDQIADLARGCKYRDCTHTHEPGCAVRSAVKSGMLEEGQRENYLNLKKEARYHRLSYFQKRQKDRQFGKFIKVAKKQLKNYGKY
jgi:ribosome biogenesis GTPase